MSQSTFSVTAGVIFLLIALGHLSRVVFGLTFEVAGVAVPTWASAIVVIVAGYLAFEGVRLGRTPRPGP